MTAEQAEMIEEVVHTPQDFVSLMQSLHEMRYHGKLILDFNYGTPSIAEIWNTRRIILDRRNPRGQDSK